MVEGSDNSLRFRIELNLQTMALDGGLAPGSF